MTHRKNEDINANHINVTYGNRIEYIKYNYIYV